MYNLGHKKTTNYMNKEKEKTTMKKIECTFYRPAEVNVKEFYDIVEKLSADLHSICNEEVSKEDVRAYAERLISQAKPLKKNPEMYFLGLDEPNKMPSDARVDYFYKPTYLGTAIVMKTLMMYPEMLQKHSSIIHGLMLGCTGRGFSGHGFDGLKGLIEALRIFAEADCGVFISKYPKVCPEFTRLYAETSDMLKERIAEGSVCNEWGEDYTEAARTVIAMQNTIK